MKRVAARTAAEIDRALPELIAHLRADGLIAYPTETVYGFGGAVTAAATRRLRALKQRDAHRPFLVLISDPEQAPGVQWTDASRAVARRFWPGPLTLALPAVPDAFPPGITSSDGRVALRASPHPVVRALTSALGGAITSTSANAPGAEPARSADAVLAALDQLEARDVPVLDAGTLPASEPSTLVAVDDHTVRVLRAGAIATADLRNELSRMGFHVE